MTVLVDVINESTKISDSEILAMIPAFQIQWNRDLQFIWKVESSHFSFIKKGAKPTSGSWWMVFLDNSDQAGALAYHDLTNEGLPISKVFVETILQDNDL